MSEPTTDVYESFSAAIMDWIRPAWIAAKKAQRGLPEGEFLAFWRGFRAAMLVVRVAIESRSREYDVLEESARRALELERERREGAEETAEYFKNEFARLQRKHLQLKEEWRRSDAA